MIRINLLGRPRPKVRRRVPIAGSLQLALFLMALAAALLVLGYDWYKTKTRIDDLQVAIAEKERERRQMSRLEQKIQQYEAERRRLDAQIKVIDDLKRNQAGPVRLLEAVGDTVSQTDTLWLTAVDQRSANEIEFQGMAGSLKAVADFITNLKRSEYFDSVELKESAQQPQQEGAAYFKFILTAKFALPASPGAASAPAAASGGGG